MRELIVAGAGIGQLTPEVREAVSAADVVFSSPRFWHVIPEGKRVIDIKSFTDIDSEAGQVLVLVSGDPGIFSLLPRLKHKFPDVPLRVLPGISSLQAICARAGESWSDAAILSGHGRPLTPGVLLNTVERSRITVLFCDRNRSPEWACRNLSGMSGIEIFTGERLGTPTERVMSGTPEELSGCEFAEPAIVLVRNSHPYSPKTLYPRDGDFIRVEGVVMTNESVRSVILGRLNLSSNSVFWDIGAGTGSISIAAGLAFPYIDIHAVDYKPEAAEVISLNAQKFHLHNITIHESRALGTIKRLPEPSSVFIGGSEGELSGILEYLSGFNNIHVVSACVTLETLTKAYELMRNWNNFESVQVSISSSKFLTPEATLMKAQAPVTVLSADT